MSIDDLCEAVKDREWRLRNLYLIVAEDGEVVPFEPNEVQEDLLVNPHHRIIVPKARKRGVSTFSVLWILDECLFRENWTGGIIDLTERDAYAKLQMARFAWENGPRHPDPLIREVWIQIHKAKEMKKDSSGELAWTNGSSIVAGTSLTGRTPQIALLSEYSLIAAQQPEKAARIKRGALGSIPTKGTAIVESTVEIGYGDTEFDKLLAQALGADQSDLSPLDWSLRFYSWLGHPSYRLPGRKPKKPETRNYFAAIKRKHGLSVPPDRQAWWEAKKEELGPQMGSQYPTVLEETQAAAVPGQIYPEMITVREDGRVTKFEPEGGYPCYGAFDLGASDHTAGWCVQPAGKDINLLDFNQAEGAGAIAVAAQIRKWQQDFPGHYAGTLLPHDANITGKDSGKTYVKALVECGIPREQIIVVPRISDVWLGIDMVRLGLPNCWFHERCDVRKSLPDGGELPSGVQSLERYRKKIDKSTGISREVPLKDGADHAADALRTFFEGREKIPALHRSAVAGQFARLPEHVERRRRGQQHPKIPT